MSIRLLILLRLGLLLQLLMLVLRRALPPPARALAALRDMCQSERGRVPVLRPNRGKAVQDTRQMSGVLQRVRLQPLS